MCIYLYIYISKPAIQNLVHLMVKRSVFQMFFTSFPNRIGHDKNPSPALCQSALFHKIHNLSTWVFRSENNYTAINQLCNIFVVDTSKIYAKIITLTLERFKERMKKNLKTPTKLKGKRKHGFRARTASAGGKKIIKRRRQKGRKRLTK